jgi:hypothetical protein
MVIVPAVSASIMRESTIEQYLVRSVAAEGGVAEKFNSPGRRNVPDRLVSWPLGYVDFVEVKRPGEVVTDAQRRDHARRRRSGHNALVISSIQGVHNYVASCRDRNQSAVMQAAFPFPAYGRSELMALAAFRYCLGRRSYIVGDCTEWLINIWPRLGCNIRTRIMAELEEEFEKDDVSRKYGKEWHPLGTDMDRRSWETVRALWKA